MKEVLKAEEAKPVQETKSSDSDFVMNPITDNATKPKSKTDSDIAKIVYILIIIMIILLK